MFATLCGLELGDINTIQINALLTSYLNGAPIKPFYVAMVFMDFQLKAFLQFHDIGMQVCRIFFIPSLF